MSYLPLTSMKAPVPQSGVTDTLKTVGSGAWDIFTGIFKQQGAAEAYKQQAAMTQAPVQPSGMPSWLPYAALGGGALVLVLLLKKKRS